MNFYMPTRLLSDEGCLAAQGRALRALGERCVIVTSGHAAQASGALADATAALVEANIAYDVWDGVAENPSLATCAEAGRLAAERGAEFILGIGGGSALDAAKAIAVFAANPALDETGFYALAWERDPLPIALVGTTAGTGSEVTKVAVLTDSAGRKHSIHDDRLYAALAFGDARYVRSCPRATMLSCGVDVLAHATESYFSHKADEVSRSFAVRAVRMAVAPLDALASGAKLADDQLRGLYEASILAGLAINTTGTCFPHNVGYYLTETRGVAHGFASAAFLPELLEAARAYDPAYAQDFAAETGIDGVALARLVRRCLPDFGVQMSADEVERALPRWEGNGSVQNTRAEVATADIRNILMAKFVQR